jgi:hypothetical protein
MWCQEFLPALIIIDQDSRRFEHVFIKSTIYNFGHSLLATPDYDAYFF